MKIFKQANLYGEGLKDILVAGKIIQDIDENLDQKYSNIEVEDLEGKIVIPALIDQHVHTIGGGGEGGPMTRCPELKISDIIKSGVSTLVGMLGTDSYTRSIENLVAKTKAIKEYGFRSYCLTGSYRYPSNTLTGSVEKDLVYIDEIIGVKLAYNDHRCSHPRYEEIVRLASEVRLGGLVGKKPGIVHVHMGSGKHGMKIFKEIADKENIPITVFRPTHLDIHMEEAILFAESGGYIDFTTMEDEEKSAMIVDEALRRAPKDRVTMSSDSNGSMPKWNEKKKMIGISIGKMSTLFNTVRVLVKEYHYSLKEALAPCTENVAKALQLEEGIGKLDIKSPAEFLVLDDNLMITSFYLGDRWMMKDDKLAIDIYFE